MLTGLYGEKKMITRIQAKHVMLFNYNPAIKGPIIEIMMEELLEEAEQDALLRFREKIGEILHSETLTHAEISAADISAVKEKMYSSAAGSWDDSLPTRFRNLMVNEKLFLQPSLSLDDIAERLHTNKTYVSKLVNNTYKVLPGTSERAQDRLCTEVSDRPPGRQPVYDCQGLRFPQRVVIQQYFQEDYRSYTQALADDKVRQSKIRFFRITKPRKFFV